ncbi:MAG: class II fumarate hydratase [Deltaproteobacteria bacterium]|nr:class II fumarate hydratase [Deltaproteobacteria bacterium]MBW2420043.1 class II fumarate hydratase [Deltaproteobacteria bacterium]
MAAEREKMRIERDSMGEMEVPADALWGASTQRAVLNFPVSGERFPPRFVRALGIVKEAAAAANAELGTLDSEIAEAIQSAAREVAEGVLDSHFVLDIFQTGSGTSINMNANEVIANRAAQLRSAGGDRIHPNDHVNYAQSSNDVIPTVLHIAARQAIHEDLLPALRQLRDCLARKAQEFDDVVKVGRTHLMDAAPVRLGQEFAGYARQIELGLSRVESAMEALAELALGGTAVGTGLNCPPEFPTLAIARISQFTGLQYREAADHFEAQGGRDAAVETSGALKTLAVSLYKIANDIRLLGSGPRCGLGELALPPLQPGSSMMPGKVNPVICESVTQVSAQVIGNDAAVTVGGLSGHLELNAFIPVIARNLLESIRLLANVSTLFVAKCLEGIEANREHAKSLLDGSLAMVTALAPVIGHDIAAQIAEESFSTGRSVRALCLERKLLAPEELERLLDPRSQT